MQVIPFLKNLQRLLQLIDTVIDHLNEAGVLKSNCIEKAKQVIRELVDEWYSEETDNVKQFFSLQLST